MHQLAYFTIIAIIHAMNIIYYKDFELFEKQKIMFWKEFYQV